MSNFVHPLTGEVLELHEVRLRLAAVEEKMAPLFRERSALRQAYAELVEPGAMPRPRDRTDKQSLVLRCPRCSRRIPADDQPETVLGSRGAKTEGT